MKVIEWTTENKLTYNVKKTKAIFYSSSGNIRLPVIYFQDTKVELDNKLEYLGVTLDTKNMFLEHVKKIRRKVQRIGNKLWVISRKEWGTKPEILKLIYRAAIKPLVLYAAEIWGVKANDTRIIKQLDAIQRPFLLAITRSYRTTSNVALQVLAGEPPLYIEAALIH